MPSVPWPPRSGPQPTSTAVHDCPPRLVPFINLSPCSNCYDHISSSPSSTNTNYFHPSFVNTTTTSTTTTTTTPSPRYPLVTTTDTTPPTFCILITSTYIAIYLMLSNVQFYLHNILTFLA
ncbi:hypothetical protein E2C01_042301 [Portunus trituberculatus]|uniref:Uncharacterized protein n=1 Tax=Portunus trituberculatus TaxID=210409 RepID=A0A5B7FT29_PORTR|nr:hypothetical protein [Portunus trituberculatus]